MNIKDYLPYYLGCDCWEEYNNKIGKLVAVNDIGEVKILHNTLWTFTYKEIKPILRRLSDMTEQEMKVHRSLMTMKTDGVHSVLVSHETPQSFHYLLKQGFDLWGLIDAGAAIDSNTINK